MPLRLHVPRAGRLLLAAVALALAATPAASAVFTDAAGRRVNLPDNITRILPAERNAEVLVYALAPERLAGLERLPGERAKLRGGARPPVILFRQDSTPEGVAQVARNYRANLIIDAGPVTPERAAFADAVQQQSGIPYILVYDGFDRLQQVFVSLGEVFGARERAAELRLFFEYAITRVRGIQQIRPTDDRPHVYYALGPDGLTTALPGSPAGAAIDAAGGINVAGTLGRVSFARVSREQLLSWNPGIIIAEDPRFFDALRRDRAWRGLSAVRQKKVYMEPNAPFGWLNDPPGVNRLIGLYWLATLFYDFPGHEDLRGITCEFYDKFYRLRLTNAQLNNMLEPAGIPRPEPPRPIGQPLTSDPRTAPALPESAPPYSVPVLPGTDSGIAGMPSAASSPSLPNQADALCTIPGLAGPITGLEGTVPDASGLPAAPGAPAVPGGRIRQPRAGRAIDTPSSPGLPLNPAQ
jgi:iron complex transport system substrate-binding protein